MRTAEFEDFSKRKLIASSATSAATQGRIR
jgi:hypothetical protein